MRSPFILLVLILSTSCGPIFSTEYKFNAPSTESGKRCVAQCPEMKEQCLEVEKFNKEQCDEINRRHMEDCQDEISRREKRAPKWNECGKIRACGIANEKCEEIYRSCYQSCGGEVRAEKVCVANCDELNKK